MKVGLSSYSLVKAINAGDLTILEAIQWVADNGGEHMELVPYGYTVVDNWELATQIKEKAASVGIELSAYCMPANFIQATEEEFQEEVARIKGHIDVVNHMGIKVLRHDVTAFTLPKEHTTVHYFDDHFDEIVRGSQLVADYAQQYGMVTTIENHGFNVQSSDRVQRVLRAVQRENFKTTLDIGNFLCADEDPLVGVKKNLSDAATVHFKDFYIRPYYENPGEGEWFRTVNDNYLRGAIVGHGELPIREIIRLLKENNYDGYIVVEFEGMEDCFVGSRIGMNNVKRLWDEVTVEGWKTVIQGVK
ncbi:sugar phosphate isomerase/epimerase family protein [Alkalihalobacillus pseudalcaliphilus]|uniref:sugar phosphate isomerase/epimerase family protein n=1 Tax=Alkalihalobacillus pseudalcaliphilus TaxID=79884 RepID=UPI00064E128B|nr:sugar phosphate isomerase/epimerase [Alkalihalobacillus pseudalcaliphilus]KMK75159.1 sugar phosphate isomerase [Alkalihalobacillus pseudalcaliphilus]